MHALPLLGVAQHHFIRVFDPVVSTAVEVQHVMHKDKFWVQSFHEASGSKSSSVYGFVLLVIVCISKIDCLDAVAVSDEAILGAAVQIVDRAVAVGVQLPAEPVAVIVNLDQQGAVAMME